MIDIENELFTLLAKALRAKYRTIFVTGTYVDSASTFPCVSIVEIENRTHFKTQSSFSNENHVQVTYEINVFTNDLRGKKAKAKEIFSLIDDVLLNLGFSRILLSSIPNGDDKIHRIVGRYRCVISKDKTIYRR